MTTQRKLENEMIKDIQRFGDDAEELYRVIIPGKVVELRKLLQHLEKTGAFHLLVTVTTTAQHHPPPKITRGHSIDLSGRPPPLLEHTGGHMMGRHSVAHPGLQTVGPASAPNLGQTVSQTMGDTTGPNLGTPGGHDLGQTGGHSLGQTGGHNQGQTMLGPMGGRSLPPIPQQTKGGEEMLRTCDPSLHRVMAILKPFYADGLLHASKINTWLGLLVQKSTDEFAVLTEARHAIHKAAESLKMECKEGLQAIVDFYRLRAKHLSKACKYPRVEDYLVAVREGDEARLAQLHLSLQALGERYTMLYDALFKNSDIVNAPLIYKTDLMY